MSFEERQGMMERALGAMLAHRDAAGTGAVLVQRDQEATVLVVEASGERVVLFLAIEGRSPLEVAAAFKALVKKHNAEGSPASFILGGDEMTAARAIKEAKPRLMLAPLGFYHLDDAGRLSAHGYESKWVEAAGEKIATSEPPDREQLEAAVARTRVVALEQAQIAGKLRGRYAVTASLTAVCVGLFVLRYVWPEGGDSAHLLRMGANFGPRVAEGEWWRLFASAFLHADPVHLIANMVALWAFGTVLEGLLGPRRYLVLYGASALAGALASAFLTSPRVSVGASGAVWGLMVAGIALVYRPQGLLPPSMLAAARSRAWAPLAINVLYSFRPGVDFLAHLGGGIVGGALFLSGVITAGLGPLGGPAASRRDGRAEKPLWSGLAVVMAAAMGASVIAGMVAGKPWKAGDPPEIATIEIGNSGLEISLPQQLAEARKEEKEPSFTRYTYGTPGDPVVIDVALEPLSGEVSDEVVEAELEALQKAVGEHAEAGVESKGPPRIEQVGKRRAVIDRRRVVKAKIDVTVWHFVIGSRLVVMRAFVPEGRPTGWIGVEEKIAESIARNE
ncbi:MAG: rhomboid family intramembrane serine protease [Polyangiaceae bacterium]